ncbi:ribonuclease III [Candidatus Contubernalis alkaliaceticus]|uniref:ribonuclease III n=1 Tax=Candidatus Contubernalis alkaliaceticus TaxID=338645 RepID=UPI001F4C1105|nr:ribonuclease III [Candidatus Contubernalis alkalaceticus]UNC92752.1 ribonuclease III [Candidatus Contubernalis alkalaceticus]
MINNSECIIARKLDIKLNNPFLVSQALIHSSFAHENKDKPCHNERLEFLGDAVLELIISEYLYRNFPKLPEGELTKLRASIVCETSLVEVARELNLGEHLSLGRGEQSTGGQDRPSILADALEALIGAVYLDQGINVTCRVVINLFNPVITVIKEGALHRDYKTMVQELSQLKYHTTPRYKIVSELGPDHDKVFVAQILLKEKILGEGRGKSKKNAEQEAARIAWVKLQE